ncbi:MAG: DUF4349 domain-containing protein [Clostridia bacterium]|nr:DUF4349 domain-containing protein [Clostridia bacterium]
MKKSILITRLSVLAAFLMIISLLMSCSAGNHAGMDMEIPQEEAKGAGDSSVVNYSQINNTGEAGEYARKIIRTAVLDCETQDFDGAIDLLMSVLKKYDGYTETESVRGSGYATGIRARSAEYTFRVPSAQLDAFLNELRTEDGIRITRQNMGSDEVTSAYYDLESRLGTLESEKAALTEMLAGFKDYNDIHAMLDVQERLYNVIEEIEATQTQLRLYDNKVAMSTVRMTLEEVITYTEVEEPTFGQRMKDAFVESWKDFGRGWQNFAVWFIEAFPTLLILAGIGVGIFFFIRALVRRGRRKRAAAREAAMAQRQAAVQSAQRQAVQNGDTNR